MKNKSRKSHGFLLLFCKNFNPKTVDKYIAVRYTVYRSAIYRSVDLRKGYDMDAHIKKVYVPMTETAFFILLCLRKPNHGYGIVQRVEKMTEGAIKLAPGTMYGSLSKMEKDKVIRFNREEDKRKIYEITELGLEVLQIELQRIARLYKISQEEM